MKTMETDERESTSHQDIGVDEYGLRYYIWAMINALMVLVGVGFCIATVEVGPIALFAGLGLILGGQVASRFQDIRYNALCETAIHRHEARMRQKYHRQPHSD